MTNRYRLPVLSRATLLNEKANRLFIGAYGFEDRSLGWVKLQENNNPILDEALLIRYRHGKGKNKVKELRNYITQLGDNKYEDIFFDYHYPFDIEDKVKSALNEVININNFSEVIVDISAMNKLLVLVVLCSLLSFQGAVRIVYSEAEDYAPSKDDFDNYSNDMAISAKFPNRGVESVIRTKCLSSVRMQGQPVTLIAFTSFNEQLIRHMLGSISPHRLIFINGEPPREDYKWREVATFRIHEKLIHEFPSDNTIEASDKLARTTSTLDYTQTIECLNSIYAQYGSHERIICAATGSKMQTVGLFFSKVLHPDIHIEYPTPDSYYVKGFSNGVRAVYEILFPGFSNFIRHLKKQRFQV